MKNRDHKTRFGILLLTVFWLGMFPAKVRAEENAYTGSSMDSDRNHSCAVVNQKWSCLFYRRESDLIPIE